MKTKLIITGLLTLIVFLWSCDTQVAVNFKNKKHTNIGITVNIEEFFATYMQDLFGFEKFSDLINKKALTSYFTSIDGITTTDMQIKNETHTVHIAITTDNFLATLSDLDVLIKQDTHSNINKVVFRMTKDVFTDILMDLPGFNTVDASLLLAQENGAVPKESYAEYISWALNDYADSKYIKKNTENSYITLNFIKSSHQGNMPDTGWKSIPDLHAQQKKISFIEWLYADEYVISFTY